jgi:hypothetical protein
LSHRPRGPRAEAGGRARRAHGSGFRPIRDLRYEHTFVEAPPTKPPVQDADLPLEQLAEEITRLSAHLAAATCRWLVLVGEFDRRAGWQQWGCRSCADWLAWRCGLVPGAAREHVRVARALADLPRIRETFDRGELSYSQVRALTRVATAECEAELVLIARYATAAQLERVVRTYRGVLATELAAVERAYEGVGRRAAYATSAGSSLPARRSRPRWTAPMNFVRLTSSVLRISSA